MIVKHFEIEYIFKCIQRKFLPSYISAIKTIKIAIKKFNLIKIMVICIIWQAGIQILL